MLKKIIASFKMAIGTMHGNLFHTLLSILGMIIGVAALVSILSLIDGMEQYAKDQISQTTSLKSIVIAPRNTKTVNGISVKKDSFEYITYPKFVALRNAVTKPAQAYLISTQSAEVVAANQKIVSMVYGCSEKIKPSFTTQKGRIFSIEDFENNPGNAVINVAFANAAKEKQNWLNEKLNIHQREVNVIGIIDDKAERPEVYLPITTFTYEELKAYPPSVAFDVENIEDVSSVKETIRIWMKKEYPNNLDDMELMTHEFRLEQATQGFMLFRVIMGLIVGISVIVGGIGVMNVMLISVTQRTTEIGVRKALGANRKDIVLQFLAEAVSISTLGSVCGLILGILGTMAIIPIVKAITKVPFQASYTWNTIGVVAVLSILLGIV
ncbi:MAG: ABC transporter permease, partial [Flammeovirgaceae bacterium]